MPGLMQREYTWGAVGEKTINEVFGKKAKVNTWMKSLWGLIHKENVPFAQK